MAEATLFDLTQRCPRCQRMLGRDHYPPSSWGTKGNYCRSCASEYMASWKSKNLGYNYDYYRGLRKRDRPARALPSHAVLFGLDDLRIRSINGKRRKLGWKARHQRKTPEGRRNYQSMHTKLGKFLGPARRRICVECGEQADEWAYDHSDPNELEGLTRRGRMAAYSDDPNHYQPMCRSCHSLHDRAHWFARRLAPVLDSHGIDPEVRDTILKEIKSFR